MARQPRPWYWKARKAWYVQIDGKQIKLHADKQEADREFRRILVAKHKPTKWTIQIKDLPIITAGDSMRVKVNSRDDTIAIQWTLVDGTSGGVRLDAVKWAILQTMLRDAGKRQFGLP